MTSDKKSIALITEIFSNRGGEYIIISPGSRNAPVIISFSQHPKIKSHIVVDERSAAFIALGIAQKTGRVVALSCTSGTAVLNYAPAIAEAYYQKIPLLILTADRPSYLIDQADGQTIRQKNIYKNYIKKSFEITENIHTKLQLKETEKVIHEAIDLTMNPVGGPVHINLPFIEPLYGQIENHHFELNNIQPEITKIKLSSPIKRNLLNQWENSKKKLIIVGLMKPDKELINCLITISKDKNVVILAETTANINSDIAISGIDKVIASIDNDEVELFNPDLLISVGGPVVSKMIKSFLRNNKPTYHWHIDIEDDQLNTYQCLTTGIKSKASDFFKQMNLPIKANEGNYQSIWWKRYNLSNQKQNEFLDGIEFCDLKVFDCVFNYLPENSQLHLANSTPVRYTQLFKKSESIVHYSNRGTSGIDGSVSTALGSAIISGEITTLITGDLAFLYDSNALMFKDFPKNLRIIIMNNGGGGIFRFIPGPDTTDQLEKYFEAHHSHSAKHLAIGTNIQYFEARNIEETEENLKHIFNPEFSDSAILEVFTPHEKNGEILRAYFNYIKK